MPSSRTRPRRWPICRKARVLGTSSVRRAGAVLRARPDLDCRAAARQCRYAPGQARRRRDGCDAAGAGRPEAAGPRSARHALLDSDDWLPALAQGAIGIEIRETDARARERSAPTQRHAHRSRRLRTRLPGGARWLVPLRRSPALRRFPETRRSFRGEVLAPDGSDEATTEFTCDLGQIHATTPCARGAKPARSSSRASRMARALNARSDHAAG